MLIFVRVLTGGTVNRSMKETLNAPFDCVDTLCLERCDPMLHRETGFKPHSLTVPSDVSRMVPTLASALNGVERQGYPARIKWGKRVKRAKERDEQ